MPADNRLFGTFTLDMMDSPKIDVLSDSAFRGWQKAIFWSRRQLTDGFIPDGMVKKFFSKKTLGEVTNNHPERPSLFKIEGGYQIHDFDQHQSTKADIEAKREAGRKGGRAKAAKSSSEPVAGASEVLKQTSSKRVAKTETETETTISNEIVIKPKRPSLDDLFNKAWEHWPKKVDRADAKKRFTVAAKKVDPSFLAGLIASFGDAYSATTEKQFVPALGSWLHRERWTDELPSAPKPRGGLTPEERARQTLTLATDLDLKEISG